MFQKKVSLLPLLIFVFGGLMLQAQDCKKTWATATAPSGLILRKSPGSGYLDKIPLGDTVNYCSDSTYGELSFDGIDGYWRKVSFNGKTGYSFDGFLKPFQLQFSSDSLVEASKRVLAESDSLLGEASPKPEAKPNPHPYFKGDDFQFLVETYNYCGNVQDIKLKLYWYGVYMDSEIQPTGQLAIRPLNLNVSLSKTSSGSAMEFDLLTDEEERSLFIFGVNNSYPYQEVNLADVLTTIGSRGKRLFPGQEWLLDAQSNLRLSATGAITKAGPCPEVENYTLKAIKGSGSEAVEQDLKEIIGDYGTCSIPEIYWYGDLSGDGLPEIIFVSEQDEQNVFTLLQSDPHSPQHFSLKAVFTVENCAN